MNIAHRLSPNRLLVLTSALLAAAVAAAVVAAAAVGDAARPAPKPLLSAALDSFSADRPPGVTARIRFTNNLVPAGALTTTESPLLTGGDGRLWLAADGRFRAELESDLGDLEIASDGRTISIYDAATKTVYEAALPAGRADDGAGPDDPTDRDDEAGPMGPGGVLGDILGAVMGQATLSDAIPTTIAGRPAYAVRVSPKHDGGLLGAVELAFDAERPVPLRLGLYAAGDTEPVVEIAATEISYASVPERLTRLTVPDDARRVELRGDLADGDHGPGPIEEPTVPVEGVEAVRAALPFPLAAPAALVGLPRQAVRLVRVGGEPAALVTYGEGLGALLVLESAAGTEPAEAKDAVAGALPKVSIDGAEGFELATALGTMLRFTEDGVAYTLVGSLPANAAEVAARELLP